MLAKGRNALGFLKKLFGGGGSTSDNRAMHLYIKCGRCGTPVHVRVDLSNDLAADYGDNEAEGYVLRKEVMDDRCFRLMQAEVVFDARRNEISRTIEGGEYISQEAYDELKSAK